VLHTNTSIQCFTRTPASGSSDDWRQLNGKVPTSLLRNLRLGPTTRPLTRITGTTSALSLPRSDYNILYDPRRVCVNPSPFLHKVNASTLQRLTSTSPVPSSASQSPTPSRISTTAHARTLLVLGTSPSQIASGFLACAPSSALS
jgi:hypothetical protein